MAYQGLCYALDAKVVSPHLWISQPSEVIEQHEWLFKVYVRMRDFPCLLV